MPMPNTWWSNVRIPEHLRRYCNISAQEVTAYTQEAAKAADPTAKLQALLISRAQEKLQAAISADAARMTEDKRRIEATHLWPLPWLPMKSQPWITNAEGSMSFGRIEAEDLTTVLIDGSAPRTYGSLDELVRYWSPD